MRYHIAHLKGCEQRSDGFIVVCLAALLPVQKAGGAASGGKAEPGTAKEVKLGLSVRSPRGGGLGDDASGLVDQGLRPPATDGARPWSVFQPLKGAGRGTPGLREPRASASEVGRQASSIAVLQVRVPVTKTTHA
jgi:hypothetical protein